MEFWGNEGAGLLVISASTGRILVPLRSRWVMEPLTWGVIGGKIDYEDEGEEADDPDPEAAAVREFIEETGYQGLIEVTPAFVYEHENEDGDVVFTYYNFIGVVEDEFVPQENWETERFAWMALDQLLEIEPKHYGLQALLDDEESLDEIRNLTDE